ncbi:Integrase [Melia azedarach]|uniref:Integrase n=1 Tax=Melia azedarach TaxID=155640 RepID=A0ACC1YIG9_MELAZ|nr:Integrase [Melia azedarach]
MAENESIHGENENPHVRTMREYLQPPRNSSPSCFIFPLNANNFNFKPDKDPEEALEYLDHLAENSQSWQTTSSSENSIRSNLASSSGGKYTLSQEDDLSARVANLTRKIEAMELRKVKEVKSVLNDKVCGICEVMGHCTQDCPNVPIFKEMFHDQANSMNTFKKPFPTHSPYSETYNPGWRNHPNFSWKNEHNVHPHPQRPSNFQPYHSSHSKTLEKTLQAFMQGQTSINNQTSQAINQ